MLKTGDLVLAIRGAVLVVTEVKYAQYTMRVLINMHGGPASGLSTMIYSASHIDKKLRSGSWKVVYRATNR